MSCELGGKPGRNVPSRAARMIWLTIFFCAATLSGIIFSVGHFRNQDNPPSDKTTILNPYARPGIRQYVAPTEDQWSFDDIRDMVSQTKGYYARDYSVWLGWNNLRYIIEAGLLHARLLNRTLVIPSHVYARGCEREIHICADFATMVNRGEVLGMDDWRYLPIEKQMAWLVPINIMLDLDHLRRFHPVITVAEFLELQGLDKSKELLRGRWGRTEYLQSPDSPSLAVIPNEHYDHGGHGDLIRVETLPPSHKDVPTETRLTEVLLQDLPKNGYVIDLEVAETLLESEGLKTWNTAAEFETILEREGWIILHTFGGSVSHLSVVLPIKQVARRELIRGLVDDYDKVAADVLLLEGETHSLRKPGNLRFTSQSARDDFAHLVLRGVRPIPPILEAGERIAYRMFQLNDRRMWIAAHMRRGDFVDMRWQTDTFEHQVDTIKAGVAWGIRVLRDLVKNDVTWTTYDVPNATVDRSFLHVPPPEPGDRFYLATDERSEEHLAYFHESNFVLIMDLLIPEDRRLVGWPLLLTDVVSILDQVVMSRAAFFRGRHSSSVDGGVLNMRAGKGMDPRTTFIDDCTGTCNGPDLNTVPNLT